MTDNEKLKLLLQNGRLVCLSKLQTVEFDSISADTNLVRQEIHDLYRQLERDKAWNRPIDINENSILTHIQSIEKSSHTNLPTLLENIHQFLQLIRNQIIFRVLETRSLRPRSVESSTSETTTTEVSAAESSTVERNPILETHPIALKMISEWNLRVLDALRLSEQHISHKVQFFKDEGIDMDNDNKYIPIRNRYEALLITYRDILDNNEIESTKRDVESIRRLGEAIGKVRKLPPFFALHHVLNNFMASKIPPVA